MISQETLTLLSSGAIVASGACLVVGWAMIRVKRDRTLHARAMLAATAMAGFFLVAYVTRWALYGSKPFEGEGAWKALYLGILAPHILLAMVVPVLAARLLWLALRTKDYARHRKLARITFPIWIFVSASGWAIYWLLYRLQF